MAEYIRLSYRKSLNMPLQIVHYNMHMTVTQWKLETRIAPFWYFYWNPTPGAFLVFGERRVALTPDIVVLIPPFTPYSTDHEQPFKHCFFDFKTDEIAVKRNCREIILPADYYVPYMTAEYRSGTEKLIACYEMLLHAYRTALPIYLQDDSGQKINPGISRVLDYISHSPKELCTNEHLCRQSNMSMSGFCHIFRQELEVSPAQYVSRFFLEKARIQLQYSDIPITEIAEQAGFSDRYAFSRAYRKAFSQTPACTRKKTKSSI